MKSKTLVIAGILLAFIIIQFFGYRIAFLFVNKPVEGKNYETLFNVGEEIKVKRELTNDIKRYVDLRYPNFEDEFVFNSTGSTSTYQTYNTYSESNQYTVLASYKVGVATTYYDALVKEYKNKLLLREYDITNNFDVIEYLKENYKKKVNIFSSNSNIKMHKLMNEYANTVLTNGVIREITGDLEGFMIMSKDKNKFEINLKEGEKYYYFEFNNNNTEYFTEEYVINFLNYVSIEKTL